jgi:NADH pyrophosphatase NudC (nudix superfamily)
MTTVNQLLIEAFAEGSAYLDKQRASYEQTCCPHCGKELPMEETGFQAPATNSFGARLRYVFTNRAIIVWVRRSREYFFRIIVTR